MSEYVTFAVCVAIKYMAVSVATVVAGYLIFHQSVGWIWMIFLAVVIAGSGEISIRGKTQ